MFNSQSKYLFMGRSVNYHSGKHVVIYTHIEEEEIEEFLWDQYELMILDSLRIVAPSLTECKPEWYDREVKKIAENNLTTVWISSYCGLVSISFVPVDEGYWSGKNVRGLSEHWIDQIVSKFKEVLPNTLNKVGTFSNGESVFEQV